MRRPSTLVVADFDTLAALVEVAENLIPFNRSLGLRECRINDDRCRRPRPSGDTGGCGPDLLEDRTIDMRVDHLRPGFCEWFDASATVLRTGSRVAVTRKEFHNDEGTLIVVGSGTYLVGWSLG